MKKFIISVAGEKFEVDVVEVVNGKSASTSGIKETGNGTAKAKATEAPAKPKTGSATVESPMPGNIVRILVSPGDEVTKGQTLFVLEAMKMENEIGAPASGRVAAVNASVGDAVTAGQNIIVIE